MTTATKSQKLSIDEILLNHGITTIDIKENHPGETSVDTIGTICANMAYLGYALTAEALNTLRNTNESKTIEWWTRIEPILKSIKGADRNMDRFVVYKNFPQEVLDKSMAEYWIAQIFMYMGAPCNWFAEPEKVREPMPDKIKFQTIRFDRANDLDDIFTGILSSPVSWTPVQLKELTALIENRKFDLSLVKFKENLANLAILLDGAIPSAKSATDILRLSTAICGGKPDLSSSKVKFRFNRSMRKRLVSMLEESTNLAEDFARYPGMWKDLLSKLHPGEFKCATKTSAAYNLLYNNKIETWYSKIEQGLKKADPKVLDILAQRPGEFMRRLYHACNVFGKSAANKFITVLPDLTTKQLLTINNHVNRDRAYSLIVPGGNWKKMTFGDAKNFTVRDKKIIGDAIKAEVSKRVTNYMGGKVQFDINTFNVKLQSNGAELSPIGMGTKYKLPENTKFIRSASYWKANGTVWFDNGFNLLDENFKAAGTVCWTDRKFQSNGVVGAVFSGDPVNSKELEGRACQMIDLYPEKLLECGVRYAVWNILCYSNITFSNAKDVFASLQCGEDAMKGGLFEPSRAQLTFKLEGNELTKYIAYIDLKTLEVIYIDLDLKGTVSSAARNTGTIASMMPALHEKLETVPSIGDLFYSSSTSSKPVAHIVYDDATITKEMIANGEKVYAFKKTNTEVEYQEITLAQINEILNLKGTK